MLYIQEILYLTRYQVQHGQLEPYAQLYKYAIQHNEIPLQVWFCQQTLEVHRLECEHITYTKGDNWHDTQQQLINLLNPPKTLTIQVPQHLTKQQCEDILRNY